MFRVLVVLAVFALVAPTGAVQIQTVPVGDPGNAGELSGATYYTGSGGLRVCGAVDYAYRIGTYEVTAGQYTEFLNAKAAAGDPYGLYDVEMADLSFSKKGCNINRVAVNNRYVYSVPVDWANRPVNHVDFWDACRFVNWLANGQGDGDTETGTYTLTLQGMADNTVTRNPGWTWAIPSEDEWYKAAYYKGGGTDAGYWLYPTRYNRPPGVDLDDASGNNANVGTSYVIDAPYYRTPVGQFARTYSPYGAFDMAGNVWEWTDMIDAFPTTPNWYNQRAVRGSSFSCNYVLSESPYRLCGLPTLNGATGGFRVVSVPEPSSITCVIGMLVGLLGLVGRKT